MQTETRQILLYEQVAARFVALIQSGTLQVGERLPSVRRLAAQQGVSVATVVGAYRKLENDGWLEARPQSGYYVRRRSAPRPHNALPEPEVSRPKSIAAPVSLSDMTMRVMQAMREPGLIQLGVAVCDPNIFPTRQLNQRLHEVARRFGSQANSYDIVPGSPLLRAAIAAQSMEAGCTLSPDDIVLTLGCQEALSLCLRAVCEPGDAVVLESPTYYVALQIIEVLGLRAIEVPTHPRDGIAPEPL